MVEKIAKTRDGYLILATTGAEERAAALCAMSIKISNPNASISLVVNDSSNVTPKYEHYFDYVVELPFINASNSGRTNDWQLYWATPYDNNIVIDCFSIVKENQTAMWDYLIDNHDVCFNTTPIDFRGSPIIEERTEYEEVACLKTNMYFFKKNDKALVYFKLLDPFMQDWDRDGYNLLLADKFVPAEYDSDLMHSYVANISSMRSAIVPKHSNILQTICMEYVTKEYIKRKRVSKSWTEYLNTWVTSDTNLKIHNFAVTGTLHYFDNKFLTDDIYQIYDDYYHEYY